MKFPLVVTPHEGHADFPGRDPVAYPEPVDCTSIHDADGFSVLTVYHDGSLPLAKKIAALLAEDDARVEQSQQNDLSNQQHNERK